jgi:hypothetical protein
VLGFVLFTDKSDNAVKIPEATRCPRIGDKVRFFCIGERDPAV